MDTPNLQEAIAEWGIATFGSTSTGVQKKLVEEFKEFDKAFSILHEYYQHRHVVSAEALERAYANLESEAADVVTLLFQVAYFCDFDLLEAVKAKDEDQAIKIARDRLFGWQVENEEYLK